VANLLILSTCTDGWQNLAYDEFLLRNVAENDLFLHLYVNYNCVVIGKYQNAWRECNINAMNNDMVKLVRRISGGGAVYQDLGNVNFSFTANKNNYNVPRQLELIIKALRSLGVNTQFSGRNDILAGGKKISGSAFCEIGNRCQHHGTLLINTDLAKLALYLQISDKKMQAKGVKSVLSRVANLVEFIPGITVHDVQEAICSTYKKEYGTFELKHFTVEEEKVIADIYRRHASWEWQLGRTPEFDILLEERFSWGELQLLLKVQNGKVIGSNVFSDTLDTFLPPLVAQVIQGAAFSSAEISARISASAPGHAAMADIAQWLKGQAL
jgi:lipoate-protein ligase A